MGRLVVIGSGGEPYRRYAMDAITEIHDVAMVLTSAPTWQLEYASDIRVVEPGDVGAMTLAVRALLDGYD